jgi:predicted nucleotidyltransferase
MRPSEALKKKRDEVLAIIARYPVANPRVFGSVARGEDVEGSDVDLLVDHFGTISYIDLARMEMQLEAVLGVPVGVHTPGEFGTKALRRVSDDQRTL